MHTSNYIEELFIGKNLSNYNSNDSSHSHSWNDKDYTFDNQFDKWGVEKLFKTSEEVTIRELKVYIEDT